MARIATDPNYSSPTFPRATAGTDIFVKEDVQALAAAVSTHTHGTGKGLPVEATAIPNGSITSAMIADGTIAAADLAANSVTTAKIADASITNAKLASDTARANLLTNPSFEIWQRGNGAFSAGGWTADRWYLGPGSGSTTSVSRDTANVDTGSQYCAAVTHTQGTGNSLLAQNWQAETPLAKGISVSASLRVKTATANAVRLNLSDGVSAAQTSAYHSGGGQYQTLTVTLAVAANATNLAVNIEFAASCTAYVDNAMLVVGSQAANYVPLAPADEVGRCLRYYEVLSRPSAANMIAGGFAFGTTGATFTYFWKVYKPVVPTITFSSAGTFSAQSAAGTAAATSLSATAGFEGAAIVVSSASTFAAAGQCAMLNATSGQTATISMEANP